MRALPRASVGTPHNDVATPISSISPLFDAALLLRRTALLSSFRPLASCVPEVYIFIGRAVNFEKSDWSLNRLTHEKMTMDTTTLLLIVIVVLLLGGGGYYGRGRWF